jgi:hypothetical protein
MAVNYVNIPNIVRNGFLNQHETGTSNGANSPDSRAAAENRFLRVNLEPSRGRYGNNVNKVRPKYSYLSLDKYRPDMGLTTIYTHYGDIFFVMKQSVKNRATLTGGDSLGLDEVKTYYYRSKNVLKMWGGSYWEAQIWGEMRIDEVVDYILVNCVAPTSNEQVKYLKTLGKQVYNCVPSLVPGSSTIWNITKGSPL